MKRRGFELNWMQFRPRRLSYGGSSIQPMRSFSQFNAARRRRRRRTVSTSRSLRRGQQRYTGKVASANSDRQVSWLSVPPTRRAFPKIQWPGCGFRPWSQLRDSEGFSPSSLLSHLPQIRDRWSTWTV